MSAVHKSRAGFSNTLLIALLCSSGGVWGAVAGQGEPRVGAARSEGKLGQKGGIRAETGTGTGKRSSQTGQALGDH